MRSILPRPQFTSGVSKPKKCLIRDPTFGKSWHSHLTLAPRLYLRAASESEHRSLVGPSKRNTLRLAPFDDRLHDVGRQVSKPQKPANMRVAQGKPTI